ncbi:uncharacterized protein CELE_ZK637.12 [Caenorhabditis elegans]|uniref:Uncharacterized protein ZK637.12 n=1 Tax=Caenorhabditis elegans TaxID=6239 RepID=YOUB_CAEEL|nr:Uncharacterized protein CELE_ZK637.12 [Caenorhabditis elegans]P34658.4 RecName: Full=Uncharacterized protein ZK637.12 [Caenorhabditis elegans]CAA77461.2 Uncharacterized protein CELE_ZK637.12 [Caenorhabditis elegans]|eukprot:NP_498975.2 Uncharacterized protein CELE_ZK637.12 [Caenorhabditis elegans]
MECVNCDCTVKTMDNLDQAIRALLQRGKHVNRMMDNEKLIREARRMEEVQQLKMQIPKPVDKKPRPPPSENNLKLISCEETCMDETLKNSSKPRMIYNKQLGRAESIDFDVPSLSYESSEKCAGETSPYTSASVSNSKKATSSSNFTKSETTTITELTTSTFKKSNNSSGGALVLDNHYLINNDDGTVKKLPMKVYVKQRLEDGSLDVQLVFFDENSQKVMDISMLVNGKKIRNVQFCGKDAKLVN